MATGESVRMVFTVSVDGWGGLYELAGCFTKVMASLRLRLLWMVVRLAERCGRRICMYFTRAQSLVKRKLPYFVCLLGLRPSVYSLRLRQVSWPSGRIVSSTRASRHRSEPG